MVMKLKGLAHRQLVQIFRADKGTNRIHLSKLRLVRNFDLFEENLIENFERKLSKWKQRQTLCTMTTLGTPN